MKLRGEQARGAGPCGARAPSLEATPSVPRTAPGRARLAHRSRETPGLTGQGIPEGSRAARAGGAVR